MLRIHNSLSRRKEDFVPIEPGRVRMYVCGITVYDFCHIGHARMMVVFDMVSRWLRASGYALTYVRNITDIDDKIIRRAVENGETISSLTGRTIAAMNEDLAALGVLPPDHEPRATQYVSQMLDLIGLLERKGLAYQATDKDVNFSVRRFPTYGQLSGKSIDELRAGERVSVADAKQDPLDFVLWKASKESDPQEVRWDSPWGSGRPGWHIECSAMSTALLGTALDIHGGGADLQFPHHENEIAQSEGAHGGPFARTWMHNGFVNVDDEKMSKSLGNFFTIRDVIKVFNPEVLRVFVLRAHYRSPLNYSDTHLEESRASLVRLYTALSPDWSEPVAAPDWSRPEAQRFREAMDDDFNTPIAISVLFELATELNRSRDPATERLLRALAAVLGLLGQDRELVLRSGLRGASDQEGLTDAEIEAMVAARTEAKKARQFVEADQLRNELAQAGIVLEDSAAGTRWRRG
ncbi:MAG: cysteine--tRNA ligase [Burkholderiales bacterium]|jgi:cysteinyl-tRNA synthetase